MGSHLYDSILVNPRNYSDNANNRDTTSIVDSPDMENFFHTENYGKKNSAKMSIKNENKNLHRKNNKNA
jgi:hypothetical protein